MFSQIFANFFIQAVLDADLFLHRATHALREGSRRRRLNHFGGKQALHHFASHVTNVIPRKQHSLSPLKIRKSSLLSHAKGCQGRSYDGISRVSENTVYHHMAQWDG